MPKPRYWRNNHGSRHRGGTFRGRRGRGNVMNRYFGGNRNNFYDQDQDHLASNFQPQPMVQRDVPTKRLSEVDIGVTEYINDHEGFNGIIKFRYSDFQVSEINLKGEVAKLTDMEPPELPKEKDFDEDEDLVLNKYNLEILPMETWDNISKLAVSQVPCTQKVQVDVTGRSKDHRTKIHTAVKRAFGEVIVGRTVCINDKKYVSFEKYREGLRVDRRVKWPWPGEYTYFVVHKENCDTMEAAARVAELLRLNLKSSLLGYAGTKDRRGKTSQWFSLRKVEPARIAAACRVLHDVHVGNYSFEDVNLRLGMLKGNRFRIALRNVTAGDRCIDRACELLRRDGFINYYGLQRFGTRIETPTYEIGRQLFQGNLFEVIRMILEQRPGPLQHVLHAFHTVGAVAAVGVWRAGCPRGGGKRARYSRAPNEVRIIQALAMNPKDLAGAVQRIPRNARLLYIHSYQSLLWNKVASRRLQQYGLRPAVGDLVPLNTVEITEEYDVAGDSDAEEAFDADLESDDGKDPIASSNPDAAKTPDASSNPDAAKTADASSNPDAAMDPKDAVEISCRDLGSRKDNVEAERKEVPMKVLTQEDVDGGQYTICDVVLPLPGYSIRYPPNMLDYYKELLDKDGLTLDMRNKNKQLSMSGAYRRLAVRPTGVQWHGVRYADPLADLLHSDLDELMQREAPAHVPGGKYKALLLTFTLPASCYATMALRELMKVDTSGDNQALQNNYHQAPSPSADGHHDSEGEGGHKRRLEMEHEVDAKKFK